MAKVAWNSVCLGPESAGADKKEHEKSMMKLAREYVEISMIVLNVFGEEGDAGGPLAELRTLQMLMDE
jgi:thiazole synthase ThiGH ThiG subunit